MRVALAVAATKQSMEITSQWPRWVPHNDNIIDSLTKTMQKSNMVPLLRFMKTGRLCLQAEGDEVEYRQQLQENGVLKRHKGRVIKEILGENVSDGELHQDRGS